MRRTVLAAIATLATACSGEDPPTPVTSDQNPTAESTRPSVVPTVAEAVALEGFRRHPCSLLSDARSAELRFPPKVFEGADGESGLCEWRAHEDEPGRIRDLYSLTVHVTGDPLGEAYRDGDTPEFPLFEERTVGGLPAVVRAQSNSDRYCEVVVGAGVGQGLTLVGSPGVRVTDLCERLVTAAETVVEVARD